MYVNIVGYPGYYFTSQDIVFLYVIIVWYTAYYFIQTFEKARQSVAKRRAKSVKLKFSNPLLLTVLINTAAPQR